MMALRGLLSPDPIAAALLSAPAPVPAPRQSRPARGRVNPLRVLDRVLGGQTISEGLDAERERLDQEAMRPVIEQRRAQLRALAEDMGPAALIAFETNPEKFGENLAEQYAPQVVAAGGVQSVIGNGQRVAAPSFSEFGQDMVRRDPITGAVETVATRGPTFAEETARINANNPVNVAPGGVLVDPRTGQTVAQGAPRLETLADGAELYNEAGQPIARNAPDAGNRRSYEDSIGVRRYEDTGEPVFPDDFARIRGQAESRLTAAEQAADNLEGVIRQALELSGGGETGLVGAVMGAVPGTRARQLRNVIETIKSNIGFNYLQQMRELSPTGGALGNVAQQELQSLQAVFGNLDPNMSEDQLDGVLRQILGIVGQGRALRQQAFQSQYGAAPAVRGGQPQGQSRPRARNPQTGEVIEWNGTAWVPAR